MFFLDIFLDIGGFKENVQVFEAKILDNFLDIITEDFYLRYADNIRAPDCGNPMISNLHNARYNVTCCECH